MSIPQGPDQELLEDEEYLHSLHNKVLDERRDFLCGVIEPRHHFTFLRTKGVLNREICAEIDHVVGPKARANRFIDELQRNGGTRALVHFMLSLQRDRTQMFVLKKLNETLEEFKRHPPPSIALHHNNGSFHPHAPIACAAGSTTASGGDITSPSLHKAPSTPTTEHLLRPGEPGAPLLPSFESLAKCTPKIEETDETPENIHHSHESTLHKH